MDARDVILNFPDQLKEGIKTAGDFKVDKKYNRIVVCGMGGSIIPGMIFLSWHEHQNKGPGVPILINNNYDLPSDITKQDMVICISWSGSTEETASSLKSAIEKKINTVLITNPIHPGEQVGELAQANHIKTIEIPFENIPPRWAVGYMTAVLFSILGYGKELDFNLDSSTQEQAGKDLVIKLGNKIPLFYTSYPWRKLGAFWKANFNETAKAPAYWNYLPIMVHDELAMYAKTNLPFYPILFRDKHDTPRNLRDMDCAIAILKEQEYNYSIVDLYSSNLILETIFNNYILGLWTSYYLAQNLGVNPEDITLIEKFKNLKKEF